MYEHIHLGPVFIIGAGLGAYVVFFVVKLLIILMAGGRFDTVARILAATYPSAPAAAA